ncbi:hypothetical protein Tco_0733429 [Tanacetum coccineum]
MWDGGSGEGRVHGGECGGVVGEGGSCRGGGVTGCLRDWEGFGDGRTGRSGRGSGCGGDYRRKCEAAEAAYEAKRKKELRLLECRELEFLMIDPSSLPPEKRAIIERKQVEIIRKYPNA